MKSIRKPTEKVDKQKNAKNVVTQQRLVVENPKKFVPTKKSSKRTDQQEYGDIASPCKYGDRKKPLKTMRNYINREVKYVLGVHDDDVFQNGDLLLERLHNCENRQRYKLLCSGRKDGGWYHKDIKEAINHANIRVNPWAVIYYVIIDVDNSNFEELHERFKELGIFPSFMVRNPNKSRSWHLYFGLTQTIYRRSSVYKTLHFKLSVLLYGDLSYTNYSAKNPLCPANQDHVVWFDVPNYDAKELREHCKYAIDTQLSPAEREAYREISKEHNSKRKKLLTFVESEIGSRNVSTFYYLTSYAYEFIKNLFIDNQQKSVLDSTDLRNIEKMLRKELTSEAKEITNITKGLSSKEIDGIIKSVLKHKMKLFRQHGTVWVGNLPKFQKATDKQVLIESLCKKPDIIEHLTKNGVTADFVADLAEKTGVDENTVRYALEYVKRVMAEKTSAVTIPDSAYRMKMAKVEQMENDLRKRDANNKKIIAHAKKMALKRERRKAAQKGAIHLSYFDKVHSQSSPFAFKTKQYEAKKLQNMQKRLELIRTIHSLCEYHVLSISFIQFTYDEIHNFYIELKAIYREHGRGDIEQKEFRKRLRMFYKKWECNSLVPVYKIPQESWFYPQYGCDLL